ncbi:hypothetical protein ES705_28145 [subsurface metagenome]
MKDKWSVTPLMIEEFDTQTGEVHQGDFHIGFLCGGIVGILNEGTTSRHFIEIRLVKPKQ